MVTCFFRVAGFLYASCLICMFMVHFARPLPGSDVTPLSDLLIEASKATNRGIVAAMYQQVMATSLDQWRVAEDPRFLELAMRAGDRLVKLLRLDQPEGAVSQGDGGPDVAVLVSAVRRDLAALEARMGEDQAAAAS
jgi:hypothetical protein